MLSCSRMKSIYKTAWMNAHLRAMFHFYSTSVILLSTQKKKRRGWGRNAFLLRPPTTSRVKSTWASSWILYESANTQQLAHPPGKSLRHETNKDICTCLPADTAPKGMPLHQYSLWQHHILIGTLWMLYYSNSKSAVCGNISLNMLPHTHPQYSTRSYLYILKPMTISLIRRVEEHWKS